MSLFGRYTVPHAYSSLSEKIFARLDAAIYDTGTIYILAASINAGVPVHKMKFQDKIFVKFQDNFKTFFRRHKA